MVDNCERREGILEQEVRRKVFLLISGCPGLHFRDLQRRSETATGTITYHLDCLTKAGLISAIPDGIYLRYYRNNRIIEKEKRLLELVRRKSIRHILLCLREDQEYNNEKLAATLNLSASTISWHIKKLEETKVISRRESGRKSFYILNEPEILKEMLTTYRESFMDKIVDRFIEMWET